MSRPTKKPKIVDPFNEIYDGGINEKTYLALKRVLEDSAFSFDINRVDAQGRSLLLRASWHGWEWGNKMVTLLLQYNADPNIVAWHHHRTALHYAAENSNGNIVCQLLNAGADMEKQCGTTMLIAFEMAMFRGLSILGDKQYEATKESLFYNGATIRWDRLGLKQYSNQLEEAKNILLKMYKNLLCSLDAYVVVHDLSILISHFVIAFQHFPLL